MKRAPVVDEQGKDGTMNYPSPVVLSDVVLAPVHSGETVRTFRRRQIGPEAGRALELLGHAIEYLTDEFVHEGGSFSAHNPQLEAVQLLMGCNRAVYFACPEVASLRQRFSMFVRMHLS
jgi:hypothetical protein